MTPSIARDRLSCRACNSRHLSSILDLGSVVLSDFLDPTTPNPPSVPLDLIQCRDCTLVQLRHTTSPDWLYGGPRYWYRSAVNPVMVAELQDVAKKATWMVGGVDRGVVVDVGANDGTLLQTYPRSTTKIAFEPVRQFEADLHQVSSIVVQDYFPNARSQAGFPSRSIDVLTSVACFYDLDDPGQFVWAVDDLLKDDGVWVVQLQDLASMVSTTGWDNICPEHLTYFSLYALESLLEDFDLRIVRAEHRAINGGSLRAYVRRKTYAADDSVYDWIAWERRHVNPQALLDFVWRMQESKTQIRGLIERLLSKGHTIDLYAASTKSSVLLQVCGLNHQEIRCAVERSPEKYGKVTSGTRIPIIPEGEWRSDPAPVTLLGAWGFRDAFLAREAQYLADGGAFLVPLPEVEVVQASMVRVARA